MKTLGGICFAAMSLLFSPAMADLVRPSPDLVQSIARKTIPEFVELLSLPNDSIRAADIGANAKWLEAAFQKRGFTTRLLPNNGKPLIYAEFGLRIAGAPTVLFYMHYDGMPVLPEQWAQKSPYQPVLRQRSKPVAAAGPISFLPSTAKAGVGWDDLDLTKSLGGPIDPEWRLFARSASDDKGPIMMLLSAFDLLAEMKVTPVINVKVVLDPEEEKGSPNIAAPLTAHRELLKSDALIINDGPMHPSNQPTIIFGNRGNAVVELTVFGPRSPLHSGHYGNYAPNPAQRLATLLASMKDDDGRVLVPHYYDGVKLTERERSMLRAIPDEEAAILKRLGIAKPEKVGEYLQEAVQYPSLNIRGMQSAAVGEKAANIIPATATAELDLRTTPGANAAYLVDALEKHIRAQGYHLVTGQPNDDERAKYPKIASLTLRRGSNAAFSEMETPAGTWVQDTLAETFASDGQLAKTIRIRLMGGTVPTDKLVEALDMSFVIVPLVNSDNNQHSYDENLRLGHYLDGMRAFVGLLQRPYPVATK
jgi:acetylornithine deacetylase/succinyl-diaminopimelate desuccinylase-like protein